MEGYKLKYQLLWLASQCFCVCFLLLLSNIYRKKGQLAPQCLGVELTKLKKPEIFYL